MAHSLEGCVSSLREAMGTLDSTIATLDAGVNDLPRLGKVLQTTRHFELISDPDLKAAQTALVSEIQPEVHNLLNRVSNYLDKLERREQSLVAKYELQLGRLQNDDTPPATARRTKPGKGPAAGAAGPEALGPLGAMKVQQLRQKKERLSFAIERLQLQAGQKQRELRKSMAAQPQILDEDF